MQKKFIFIVFLALFLSGCAKTGQYCNLNDTSQKLSFSEARKIAENSECTKEGTLSENSYCSQNSGTIWIDLVPNAKKTACPNPACVVSVEAKIAEINWRCMGLIEP